MNPASSETSDATSNNSLNNSNGKILGTQKDHNTSQIHTDQTEGGITGDETAASSQDKQESRQSNGSKEEGVTLLPSSQQGAYIFFAPSGLIHLSRSLLHKNISYSRIASREILVTLPPDPLFYPNRCSPQPLLFNWDRLDIRTRPWTRSRTRCFCSTNSIY